MIKLSSIEPIEVLGLFLMFFSGTLILINISKGLKDSLRTRGDILNRKEKIYFKLDILISKLKPLDSIKQRLKLMYGVINSSTENKNRIKAVNTILYITVITLILITILASMVKVWYLFILISLALAVFPYVVLFAVLNLKLNKLNKQFPEAVNIFITKYTSERNKDKALQRTYTELDNPIRYEFMRLARMMANKGNIYQAIKSFTKRVNYVWAEVFGELLILNHTTVENIGDELNELSLLMAEDQTLEAHKRAETTETKMVNVIIALFTIAGVIFNIVFFKTEAINIYFERYVGIVSISTALVTIIICLSLTFYFDKS